LRVDRVIPGVVVAAGILALTVWFGGHAAREIRKRLPQATEPEAEYYGPIDEIGEWTTTGVVPKSLPGSWPRFRGENFDGINREGVPLARSWGPNGPRRAWSIQVGEGHAGAAVVDGRVYLMDYDERKSLDTLRCFSLETGEEVWRFSYPVDVKRKYGMSRTVPAVTEKYVVAMGPLCHVICANARTGRFKWSFDLHREFHTKVPSWYTGQCPLIDRGRAIIAVGGDILMMAVDCETGDIVWKVPNPKGWKMTHSSVIPMEFSGRRMYVYCASGGVVAVSTEGKVLWETDKWTVPLATVPSPVIVGGGRLFLSGGYGAGCMMLQLRESGGRIVPHIVFKRGQKVFGAEQHTPILYKGHIYGIGVDGELVCLNLSGRREWSSGRVRRFKRGPYLIADGLLYVLDGTGVLTLVNPTPAGYEELARAKVLPGKDKQAWGPMAAADRWLLVRDLTTLTCLDVTAPATQVAADQPQTNGARAVPRQEELAMPSPKTSSVVIGLVVAAAAAVTIYTTVRLNVTGPPLREKRPDKTDPALLKYREAGQFVTGLEKVRAIAVGPRPDELIYVAGDNVVRVFNRAGEQRAEIGTPSRVRCLAVADDGTLYLGMKDHVEVYGPDRRRKAQWAGLGPDAFVTAVAVGTDSVFVADHGNLVVVRYDLAGERQNVIGEKDPAAGAEGLRAPTPFLDIAWTGADGLLYVTNPGFMRVETYLPDGSYMDAWGKGSTAIDGFQPCCNPAHLALLPDGRVVTSEKGNPRVKVYTKSGDLDAVVAGPESFPPPDPQSARDTKGSPSDVATDSEGRIYVLDPVAGQVRIFERKEGT